jgi:hypothetical protein
MTPKGFQSQEEREQALADFALGKATKEQETLLFEGAFDDQDTFDALADQALLRELLEDPESRKILLAAVPVEPYWQFRLRRFFQTPVRWEFAAACAVAALVGMVGVHEYRRQHQPGPVAGPAVIAGARPTAYRALAKLDKETAAVFSGFERLATQPKGPEPIQPSGKSFVEGGVLRLKFVAAQSRDYILVARSTDGIMRRLYPADGQSGSLSEGQTVTVPADGEPGLSMDGVTGDLTLLLVAFPAQSDPARALKLGLPLPEPLAVVTQTVGTR